MRPTLVKKARISLTGTQSNLATERAKEQYMRLIGMTMVIVAILFVNPAIGGVASGYVDVVNIDNKNQVALIKIDGESSPALCAKPGLFSMRLDRKAAKEYLATLIIAKSSGLPVLLYGSRACSEYSDVEGLDRVSLYYSYD